jgi:hypothetical protein
MKKIQWKKRKTKPNRRIKRSPIRDFWAGIKRTVLVCSALLFCGFLFAAYSEFHGMFSSRPGKVLTWSTGTALSPVFGSLPWWFWCGMIGLAIYLWVKHKLVMSIIYGILAGIYLAL